MRSLVPVLLLSTVSLSACGGGGAPGDAGPMPALSTFQPRVTHRYFPLSPGSTWTYEGSEDGVARIDEVRVLDAPRMLLGVACTGLEQVSSAAGDVVERTDEWYAQDAQGNVWKFGEESFERSGEVFVRTGDSWLAGTMGARPWLAFPAAPVVGQEFVGGPEGGEDTLEVASVSDVVTTAFGTFSNCMRMIENPDDPEDTDIILFADGIGMVSSRFPTGGLDLVAANVK